MDRPDPVRGDETDQESMEQLLWQYVERINAGQKIQPNQVRVEHPEKAHEILEQLEAFLGIDTESRSSEPLGTLGDYTLRRQIGRGGMGIVYEAWENSMDRAVALKILPAAVAVDDRAFQRFMQEAKTAGKLGHQNIVPVYSTGIKDGTPWFSMELVAGETLAQFLASTSDAEPETTTPFGKKNDIAYFGNLGRAFAATADGLQHAHSKGVTHRDIKPSNLILDQDGRLRILDFGLARLEGQESLTLSGDFVGTPLYMSPEQARRKRISIDHRTDIYSLGATLYQTLTGQPPFQGKDHHDTLSQIIERDPRPPSQYVERIPGDLETIVLQCLRKDPGDRYGTAEALAQDLRRFVRGETIEARPASRQERLGRFLFRHRKAAGVLSVMLAATLALFVGSFLAISNAYQLVKTERLEVDKQRDRLARLLYTSDIRLAQQDWQQGNYDRCVELLERHQPTKGEADLRGWEWHYLRALTEGASHREIRFDDGAAMALAWSPVGDRIAIGCASGVLRVFDTWSGDSVGSFRVGAEPVRATAWHRESDSLIASTEEGIIRAWRVSPPTELFHRVSTPRFERGHGRRPLARNPTGHLVASVSGDGYVRILDAADGNLVRAIDTTETQSVVGLTWTSDGSRLAAGFGPEGEVVVWNTSSWAEARRAKVHQRGIRDVQFSSDGSHIATGAEDQSIRILDATTLDELRRIDAHHGTVMCVRWSPDGSRLASASADGLVKVWDTTTWKQVSTPLGKRDLIWDVAWSPDGTRLACASQDCVVTVWDLDASSRKAELAAGLGDWGQAEELIAALAAAPDEVGVVDVTRGVVHQRSRLGAPPHALAVEPGGDRWAALTADALTIRRLHDGAEIARVNIPPDERAVTLAWDPRGVGLISGHAGGRLRIWDGVSWNVARELDAHKDDVAAIAWSPDGTRFASASEDETLRIWDCRSYQPLRTLGRCRLEGRGRAYTSPRSIAWSPDGQWLASTCSLLSEGLSIWSTDTFELVHRSRGHLGGVMTVAWSPDATRLATSGLDRSLKIWRVGSQGNCDELLSLQMPSSGAQSLAWSPTGRWLLADVGVGRRLRIFDAGGLFGE